MKYWWKIVVLHESTPVAYWAYDEGAVGALIQYELYGGHVLFTIDKVDESEVPVLKRGLTMATLEQLRDEMKRRGWKVTLQ